jgi:hypothetical protein
MMSRETFITFRRLPAVLLVLLTPVEPGFGHQYRMPGVNFGVQRLQPFCCSAAGYRWRFSVFGVTAWADTA